VKAIGLMLWALLSVAAFSQETPAPEYGWKVFSKKTIALGLAETHQEMLNAEEKDLMVRGDNFKVDIVAEYSVRIATIPLVRVAVNDGPYTNKRHWEIEVDKSKPRQCEEMDILETERACRVDSELFVLAIGDLRKGADAIAAGFLGPLLGDREIVRRGSAPNRVKLTLYSWDCIKNCS
jgi:hypothetical protein